MSDDIKVKIAEDKSDGKIILSHTQDVSSILAENKKYREANEGHRMGDMVKVASIPAVVAMEWMKEGINVMAPNREDLKRMKKKLNSRDYTYLRTGGGRL